MQFKAFPLSIAVLACTLVVSAAPAPQEPEPDCETTTTTVWGYPTTTSSSTWGEPSTTSTSTWGETTSSSSSTWGEPSESASSTWGESTTSPSSTLGETTGSSSTWGEPTSSSSSTWGEPSSSESVPPFGSSPSSTWYYTTPLPTSSSAPSGSQCSAGSAMCCESVTTAGQASQKVGGILNGLLGTIEGLVGIGCSAIPILGAEWSVYPSSLTYCSRTVLIGCFLGFTAKTPSRAAAPRRSGTVSSTSAVFPSPFLFELCCVLSLRLRSAVLQLHLQVHNLVPLFENRSLFLCLG